MAALVGRPSRPTARFFAAFHDFVRAPACTHQLHSQSTSPHRPAGRGQLEHGSRQSLNSWSAVRASSAATAARSAQEEHAATTQERREANVISYKKLMRAVTSPVAVVTARRKLGADTAKYAACIGATISSLSSVCISPSPVLSFNLHHDSRTATSILDSDSLTLHILSADQHGESIASAFASPAKRNYHEPFDRVADAGLHSITIDDDGHVAISGPGVIARAHCNILPSKTVTIGDHLVMFANVLSTHLSDSLNANTVGLSFAQGTYLRGQPLDAAPDFTRADSIPARTLSSISKRAYSTSTRPPSDPAFLKQTVRSYLSLDEMPKHRWRNERTLAELDRYGPERVSVAIDGGSAEAPPGSAPGGQTNHTDARIRGLIERMHVANKLGHVSDEVMEELVLGPRDGSDDTTK